MLHGVKDAEACGPKVTGTAAKLEIRLHKQSTEGRADGQSRTSQV